jgi:hypothetical protein
MSGPVDVRLWLSDERHMYGVGTKSRAKCEEAIAALAELIDAVGPALYELRDRSEAKKGLMAALARVKGESQ